MKQILAENNFYSECQDFKLEVNNGNGKYQCYRDILKVTDEQISAMLSYHSKVLVVRMDFHLEQFSADNQVMSRFMRKLKKRLKQRYTLKRIGHIWCRELEKSKYQHYHLAIMIDGHKVNYPAKVIQLAKEIWEGWELGHMPVIPKPYHMVTRENQASYSEAFYRLSYLAKVRGKGIGKTGKLRAASANDYSASRIKPKPRFLRYQSPIFR